MSGEIGLPKTERGAVSIRRLTSPTRDEVEQLAALFDEYRVHYGEDTSPGASAQWLEANRASGRLQVFVAIDNVHAIGFALATVIPASLRLGHFWQIRDLFVAPSHRRRGVGGLLLESVCDAAASDGALRVSLQTESDNATALRLYLRRGFAIVEGYHALALPLENVEEST